ncbi:MAG: hypothetical protein IIU10_03580 [Paludibacteraceae bacterium]|nr:hypothetical protein [Paludibacteraceae bacterium]
MRMKLHHTLLVIVLCALCGVPCSAAKWTTHFAYNHVTQIAMSPDKVYALSDGSLYSVDKQTEQIRVYNSQSGLHGTGISCIHYDVTGGQLIIGYANGKIDLLSARGTKYIGELYDKDMTQRKNIYNVTIQGRTAYLSTHYGVQTMDLRENKLVDSYWLRPNGQETPVLDVLIANDSIYAFTSDSLFCAALTDNLVDYTYWHREARSERITPDANKGTYYQDDTDNWYAGQAEGIVRITPAERLTYKPQGPLANIAYRMRANGQRVGIVQGGYYIARSSRPGLVMIKDGDNWLNYDTQYMSDHLGVGGSIDYCDILFDPQDPKHYYVASFGYGLIEFRNDTIYHHYNHTNSGLETALPSASYPYVWVDGLRLDTAGNLWMTNVSANGVKVMMQDGTWHSLSNEVSKGVNRAQNLFISYKNPNIKVVSSIRDGIGVIDDNGTIEDQSDDRAVLCKTFKDEQGRDLILPSTNTIYQTTDGAMLIGTELGLYCVTDPEEILNGNTLCTMIHIDVPDENRLDIFNGEPIWSIEEDDLHQVWIGTQTSGLYCLSADRTQVLLHFSTDNTPMPSNDVRSLCFMPATQHLMVGTADGLVEYDRDGIDEGLQDASQQDESLDEGVMQQWRLHLSYNNAQQVAATPKRIYAVANGSLFSVDRTDEEIVYWSKANGLNGTTVSHIAYDALSGKLIITYENGQIDLLDNDGNVTQMPDISMKAGSIAVTINSVCVGSRQTYLSMPFGIIAIQPRKGEVSDTYYIGANAASVEVQQIAEAGDTLYAFSYDKLYKASLNDNLVDYSFWQAEALPFEQVQQAVTYNNRLYIRANNLLYRREGTAWTMVASSPLEWIHMNDNQLLAYQSGNGLLRLKDDDQWEGLSNRYVAADALYSNGEYWLAEVNYGLIRLDNNGDAVYHTEGPNSNFGYCMYTAHGQIYSASGGRWAGAYVRPGCINIFDGLAWRTIDAGQIGEAVGSPAYDIVSLAVDPTDAGHFFAAAYGRGVFEFRNYRAVKRYTPSNSTLRPITDNADPNLYTYTDGATLDEQGNLWVLNATTIGKPIHILTPAGQWISMSIPCLASQYLITPTGIWTDKRNSHHKWFMMQRGESQIILLNDGGTPTYSGDDRCMARSTFVDQNGNTITPANFRCFAQDHTNRIWIGTNKGLITIPKEVDFFTSNACRRIIIPRNDGTGLGDYLLGDEQINCLAVDGGNRLWIGTANSGLYLIEDDTITVEHFTESNSLLPSNSVVSIAIMPHTGEVFVGTDKGIASYRSDASEAAETMAGAYAYPNPVRPDYGGMISIAGLMDNTVVNIVDAGGNLVCKTRSHGGTAVWDGKLPDGQRATPGVYTALCNDSTGKHTVVKILIIR